VELLLLESKDKAPLQYEPSEADQGSATGEGKGLKLKRSRIGALAKKKLTGGSWACRLRQGLVGGVKPVGVMIPEPGKLLTLTGALPPSLVRAEIEVKPRSRGEASGAHRWRSENEFP
jgi:hypothetical protein